MNCDSLNVVGISYIEYVPVSAVMSYQVFVKSDKTLGGNIILQNGYSWNNLSLHYTESEKRYWSESTNVNAAQGDTFDERIVDIFSGISSEIQYSFDEMHRERFLVRFEDENGQKFLLGCLDFPLKFKSSYDTKQAFHNIEFYGNQPNKALIWNF